MSYSLRINGQQFQLDIDGDTPLLWVIRDVAKLTGTKFGCGLGICGACTVHSDGVPIRSCLTPLESVAGRSITTIEGIGATEAGKAVQQAWLEHNVVQCGYCQSGQIMSASALLATTANPSEPQISAAMAGNLCRCGTYARIKSAVIAAAKTIPVKQRG